MSALLADESWKWRSSRTLQTRIQQHDSIQRVRVKVAIPTVFLVVSSDLVDDFYMLSKGANSKVVVELRKRVIYKAS